MLTTTRAISALSLLLIGTCFVSADIRLPKIFSDNMVLQRDAAVRIWGTADPGEELTISLGESNCPATADEEGRWSAELTPPETGGPYKLSVQGAESSVVFSEVYIGEVWVCVGESNMQRSLNQALEFTDDAAREVWLQEIDNANIRLFTVPENAIDEPTVDFTEAVSWQKCRGKDVGDFSATAYFFALALQKNETLKDVPIGLINVSLRGSTAEAWASRDALAAVASLQPMMQFWNDNPDKRSAARPSSLFNGMLAPLVRLGIRGVIWYQGETNVGRGQQYREILTTLIKDWREKFQLGDFPFYLVQINPYRYTDWDPKALPEIWDAQADVLNLPNTGIVGTSDIGDPEQLHPKNKEIIGERLARLALSGTYGIADLISSGPRFESMEVIPETNRICVQFANSNGLKQDGEQLTGFVICGKDGEFVPAQAAIENGAVMVWADEVSEPSQVRYLWQDAAPATLFNGEGLPAIPFRTDQFKLLSEGRHF
ncbi:MAG: sialate O-acetylesterase [Pirellulaceae bacterium]|nr:sialate O-acetylesterase [Pirellulaceae bacterium]